VIPPISEEAFLAEVRRVVSQTRDDFDPNDPVPERSLLNALMRASSEAEQRAGDSGKAASMIANWLIASTPESPGVGSLDLALLRLDAPSALDRVGKTAHVLIQEYAAGEMDPDRFMRIINKPLRRRLEQRVPVGDRINGLPIEEAESRLRSSLNETGVDAAREPRRAWDAFQRFAKTVVEAMPPQTIQHDTCLFQWGIHALGIQDLFQWDLVRQWSIGNEHGDYDHMQQLHLTISFDPREELAALGHGELWAAADVEEWLRDVEALPAFQLPLEIGEPVEWSVFQEEV
jgi:hypothetical protein